MATPAPPCDEAPPVSGLPKRRRLALWLQGEGIEIGALHHPLAVPAAARVTYVDRLPETELRRHYPELAAEPFAPIAVIGSAEDLSAFRDGSLDFVIANHLVEHLEDPIAALIEFHRVLQPNGVLYMALPDARMSFDRERELTSLDHLLEEHRRGPGANRLAHYRDWAQHVDKDVEPERRAATLMAMSYSIHFHVWLPDTFLEFVLAAQREAGLAFELAAFAPPESPSDNEFILVLLKGRSAELRLPSLAPEPEAGHVRRLLPSAGAWTGLRRRLKDSKVGPVLAPIYRLARRRLGGRSR